MLIVRHEPPQEGDFYFRAEEVTAWVVMLEQDGQRTRCAQLADAEARR